MELVRSGVDITAIALWLGPSGATSPACAASVQPLLRSRPATGPDLYSRTRARGSERVNRLASVMTSATMRSATWVSVTVC